MVHAYGLWSVARAQVEELELRLAEKRGQLEQVALEAERERNEQRAALCATKRELERVTNELSALSSCKAALGATRKPPHASPRLAFFTLVAHLQLHLHLHVQCAESDMRACRKLLEREQSHSRCAFN